MLCNDSYSREQHDARLKCAWHFLDTLPENCRLQCAESAVALQATHLQRRR